MRTSCLTLLTIFCAATLVCAATSAQAYVYRYAPGIPSVVTDMSALNPPAPAMPYQPQDNSQNQSRAPIPLRGADQPQNGAQNLSHPFFTNTLLSMPETVKKPAAKPAPAAAKTAAEKAAPEKTSPEKAMPEKTASDKTAEPKQAASTPAAEQTASTPTSPAPAKTAAAEKQPPQPPDANTDAAAPAQAASTPTEDVPAQEAQQPAPVATPAKPADTAPAPAAQEQAQNPPVQKTAPAVPTPAGLTLDFATTSSDLSPQAKDKLDNIATQMKDVDDLRLQIRGYAKGDGTGSSSARRMSLARVLVVRSYLMDKGIKPIRLDVQALGSATSRLPIDRVDLVFAR